MPMILTIVPEAPRFAVRRRLAILAVLLGLVALGAAPQARAADPACNTLADLRTLEQQALGSDFGGLWVDNQDGGRAKVGTTGDPAAARPAIERCGLTGTTDVVQVAHSHEQLAAVQDRLVRAFEGLPPVWSVGVDEAGNYVSVQINEDAGTTALERVNAAVAGEPARVTLLPAGTLPARAAPDVTVGNIVVCPAEPPERSVARLRLRGYAQRLVRHVYGRAIGDVNEQIRYLVRLTGRARQYVRDAKRDGDAKRQQLHERSLAEYRAGLTESRWMLGFLDKEARTSAKKVSRRAIALLTAREKRFGSQLSKARRLSRSSDPGHAQNGRRQADAPALRLKIVRENRSRLRRLR